jgi:predicted nucleic acid-binding protein
VGLIVVDAGVIIAILDASDTHHDGARAAVRDALDRADRLCVPASAYAEVLLRPMATSLEAAELVDRFLDELPSHIEPATRAIARLASGLRAEHGARLRLPDALVVATAVALDADLVLTTDRHWPGLPVKVVAL